MDEANTKSGADGSSLLLSGGGFRATLFHLGVIRYMREVGKLSSVKEVFSISGGSIIAAHLAANWSDYNGDEEQFDRAANKLVKFTQSGFREKILRNSLLFWFLLGTIAVTLFTLAWICFEFTAKFWLISAVVFALALLVMYFLERKFRPIGFLQLGYKSLYESKLIKDINADSPDFYFLATNLTTGNIACFTNTGIYPNVDEETDIQKQLFVPSSSCTLSECVAASSAFPPLFSPYAFSQKRFKVDSKFLSKPQYFTDGGVYDNLGVRALKLFSKKFKSVLVSDAERRFDWSTDTSFRLLTSRASRATDVLMNRVNMLESELIECERPEPMETGRSIKFARLKEDFEAQANTKEVLLSPELKKSTRRIRTDLDSFSDIEIQLLYTAGYSAAKFAYEGTADLEDKIILGDSGVPTGCARRHWLPIKQLKETTQAEALSELEASESVNLIKILSFRAWQCWVALLLFLAMLAFNPLTIGLIQKVKRSPADFNGNQVIFFGDEVPSYFSVPTAFVKTAMELSPKDDRKKNLLFVETDMIGASSFLPFGVSPFSFSIAEIEDCDVFYEKAFLVFKETDSVAILRKNNESPTCYIVPSAERECRVILLVGIATDIDSEVEISPKKFIFNVKVSNE